MFLILTWLISLISLAEPVAASLGIYSNFHSFGGVNYPLLQFFTPKYRDEAIRAIVRSKARVIRLFIRPDEFHTDPEPELGAFDKGMLDQFDDLLAAIHYISKGQVKVIIVPHDSQALRGSEAIPCDAYCKRIGEAFLDFYSNEEIREIYKTRLEVLFKHYPSKNFNGRPWGTLSEVVLGVDIQNQPFRGIWPISSGEYWICEIASHLKFDLGLGGSNIAVISGGISGPQKADGMENIPDSAFNCPGLDVIGIHGSYATNEEATAGTPWANMFVPGNTLTSRAQNTDGTGKLLLVEEWAYVHDPATPDLAHKNESLFDQATALNLRGIPWLYSHLSPKDELTTSRINPFRSTAPSYPLLVTLLRTAHTTSSPQNWSTYLPAPTSPFPTPAKRPHYLPLNPYIPASTPCKFGCSGFLCDSPDACAPDLICRNNVCARNAATQPGQVGAPCNTKAKCQVHLACERGTCAECRARGSKSDRRGYWYEANDPRGTCDIDAESAPWLRGKRICVLPGPGEGAGNPCESAAHCDADEYCSWGVCVRCKGSDLCLGAACETNASCRTGLCNRHGRCDYAGQKKRKGVGVGARGQPLNQRIQGVPRGYERGPARVRNEAMRIVIPEEKVMETGM